jgi:hypothetical protein
MDPRALLAVLFAAFYPPDELLKPPERFRLPSATQSQAARKWVLSTQGFQEMDPHPDFQNSDKVLVVVV